MLAWGIFLHRVWLALIIAHDFNIMWSMKQTLNVVIYDCPIKC